MGWEDDPEVTDSQSNFGQDDDVVAPAATSLNKAKKEKGWADNLDPTMRTILQMGLPAAGALAAAPFTGGQSLWTILALEGLGSLGGETVAQATGISEPSAQEQGLAFLLPGVSRGVAGLAANLPRMIPGFGEALKAGLTPEMRELPKKLLGGPSSQHIYSQIAKGNVKEQITAFPQLSKAVGELSQSVENIPFQKLQQDLKGVGLDDLFEQISGALKGTAPSTKQVAPTIGGKAQSLPTGLPKQTVVTPGRAPGLSFEEARAATEGFGRIIGKTQDPVLRGNYKKLYGAILEDLENAPLPANVPRDLWKAGREAAKREHAQFKLTEATEKAITTKEGVDVVDPNKIVNWLRKTDEIKKRVSDSEYRAISNEYRHMASVAGKNTGRIVSILGGWIAGGNASGALAGYVGGEALAKAMMSDRGRKAVRAMVGDPSRSNFRRVAAISGAAASGALDIDQGDDEEVMY